MSSELSKTILMGGCGAAALAVGAALLAPDGRPNPARQVPAKQSNAPRPRKISATRLAPYVDVALARAFDLPGTARKTGVTTFNLAFIAARKGCEPGWAGTQSLDDNDVAQQIGALRKAGGDVRVSFGGRTGTELGQACSTPAKLTAAYKKVIGAFRLTKVDFDIEGAALADSAATARRGKAIAALQRQVKGLDVSLTVPVLPSGLTRKGVGFVTATRKSGVKISAVNLMALDYGDRAAPHPSGRMGDFAIRAATSAEKQVSKALGVGTAFRRIAVTPMIGTNDTAGEVFTLADARRLAAFAQQKKLAWLSMWSAVRDRPCAGGPKSTADPVCSGIAQAPLAFSRALTTAPAKRPTD